MTDPNKSDGSGDQDLTKSGTSPNGTVSEAEVTALKSTHEDELRQRDEKTVKLSEDVTSGREALKTSDAKLQESQKALEAANAAIEAAKATATSSSERVEELEGKALVTRRQLITQRHNLKEDQLKDYSESQLDALEAVLPTLPKSGPNPANLDIIGGSGSGETPKLTGREAVRAGLSE